jgi:myo-inositol-1(or 4)-monophosphatase
VDGVPSVGVIHDPMRGETFAADVDGPAVLGRATVHASDKRQAGRLVVSRSRSRSGRRDRVRAIRKAIRVSCNMGSAALALAYVANGASMPSSSPGDVGVDVAAAGLIVERAGATVTGMAGGPWFDVERDADIRHDRRPVPALRRAPADRPRARLRSRRGRARGALC